jgi:hypothetical protein
MAGNRGRKIVKATSCAPNTIRLNTSAVTNVSVDALFALLILPPEEDLDAARQELLR